MCFSKKNKRREVHVSRPTNRQPPYSAQTTRPTPSEAGCGRRTAGPGVGEWRGAHFQSVFLSIQSISLASRHRHPQPTGPQAPGGQAMAFSSSLAFPFPSPPSGTFQTRSAGRLRTGATERFLARSSPPPDVVVTRERGKNAKLIAALVSPLVGTSPVVL